MTTRGLREETSLRPPSFPPPRPSEADEGEPLPDWEPEEPQPERTRAQNLENAWNDHIRQTT